MRGCRIKTDSEGRAFLSFGIVCGHLANPDFSRWPTSLLRRIMRLPPSTGNISHGADLLDESEKNDGLKGGGEIPDVLDGFV